MILKLIFFVNKTHFTGASQFLMYSKDGEEVEVVKYALVLGTVKRPNLVRTKYPKFGIWSGINLVFGLLGMLQCVFIEFLSLSCFR